MLKRVSIQNFKSLKDVTLDLQKINLLIGPNNSGKTNFLKALEFLKLNYREFPRRKDITITFNHTGNNVLYHLIDNSEDAVHIERMYDFRSEDQFYKVYNSKVEFFGNGTVPYIPGQKELEQQVLHTKIYKPNSDRLTRPGIVGTGEEVVNPDASNIVGFLDLMLGKYRRTVFSRIENDISICIPEFNEIKIEDTTQVSEDLKNFLGDKTFKRIGLANSEQDITYWADELSEGTLYFLALLCIINQPNPPKLLLLEEPEKGIHPRRIREVMNFIFRLAEEKDVQIILTTHNEHVLDDFATRPESVFVFDKDDEGATYVRNLHTDIIEPTNQRNRELGLDEIDLTTNLSENWLYGLLGGVPAIP